MTGARPGRALRGAGGPAPGTPLRGAGGRDTDGGYATVWAAVVVVVLVLLATIAVQVFAATSGRHRAEAAADLGALAAAGHVVDGGTVACAYAARVAERMAARLVECSVSGWEVRVEVSVTPALTLPGAGEAHGRARAGPVTG